MSEKRVIDFDEYCKRTFSSDFIKESEREYLKAKFDGMSHEIAQLKQQLADEQELTVAAYMSGAASQRDKTRELERMLAEADDAIVEFCNRCGGPNQCGYPHSCELSKQREKAKARIEARKGNGG